MNVIGVVPNLSLTGVNVAGSVWAGVAFLKVGCNVVMTTVMLFVVSSIR